MGCACVCVSVRARARVCGGHAINSEQCLINVLAMHLHTYARSFAYTTRSLTDRNTDSVSTAVQRTDTSRRRGKIQRTNPKSHVTHLFLVFFVLSIIQLTKVTRKKQQQNTSYWMTNTGVTKSHTLWIVIFMACLCCCLSGKYNYSPAHLNTCTCTVVQSDAWDVTLAQAAYATQHNARNARTPHQLCILHTMGTIRG